MSSRYDDRDYDREGQNRGRRSESDYGRSWGGRSQGRYRYGDNEREDDSYSSARGYGNELRGRGAESSGRGREYGRGSEYGSSRGNQYGGGESSRGSEYGRSGEYGRGGESGGRYSSGSRGDYQSERQNYGSYGRSNWENQRDDIEDRDQRYGGYMGGYGQGYNQGSGSYGRGYNESSRGSSESSQRYNYPSGFRSGQSYGERGRSLDYDRGSYGGSGSRYGEGESRNWTGDDRSSQSDKGDWSGSYSRQSGDWSGRQSTGDWSGSYGGRESRDWNDEGRWSDDRNRGEQQRGWWDRASDEVASWFGDEEAVRRRRMDARRGRGPKGYQRSDERIREDVNDRLTDDYYLDASDVEVQVSGAEVILTGNVNTRDEKRRAEDLAESAKGVTNVENRIRVRQGDRSTYGQPESTGTSAGTTNSAAAGTTGSSMGTGSDIGTGSGTGLGDSSGSGSSKHTGSMGTGSSMGAGNTGVGSSMGAGSSLGSESSLGTGGTSAGTQTGTGSGSSTGSETGTGTKQSRSKTTGTS